MKKKIVVKGRSSKQSKRRDYKGRGPSGKPKHSKVAKLKKLARARSKKDNKKVKSKSKKKKNKFT